GITYRITVSGTYRFGGEEGDAEYTSPLGTNFMTHVNPGTPGANDVLVVYGSPIPQSVPVFNIAPNLTAQDVDWGPFNIDHIYSIAVVGNGGPIGFVV